MERQGEDGGPHAAHSASGVLPAVPAVAPDAGRRPPSEPSTAIDGPAAAVPPGGAPRRGRMSLSDDSMDPHQLFLSHLTQIEGVIRCVCRRHHCAGDQAEEFASEVRTWLIGDDYAALRKFGRKSSFKTYITTVVQRHFLDWRNRQWGKWRPSAEAVRMGPVGVKLEELARDGHTFEESCQILRVNHGVPFSELELARLAARLPPRTPRRIEGEESLQGAVCPEPTPDEVLRCKELQPERRRVREALARALARLSPEDRLLIKVRFQSDVQMQALARSRGVEPKRLYRRLERLLPKLRRALEREGVCSADVIELLATPDPGPGRP